LIAVGSEVLRWSLLFFFLFSTLTLVSWLNVFTWAPLRMSRPMTNLESLAEDTCHNLLNARHLKAICRWRAFNPPKGDKKTLASYVAPRLLETSGVAEAMASLEEPWLLALHKTAMAEETADLNDLRTIVQPGRNAYATDYRDLFRRVADGLLNRGVVLVEDRQGYLFERRSRFERLAFHFPEVYRPLLPPYPATTEHLGDHIQSGDTIRFCRKALQKAVLNAASRQPVRSDGFLGRIACTISFREGMLRFGKAPVLDLESFLRHIRAEWAHAELTSNDSRKSKPTSGSKRGFRPAAYILSHLPPGEGITVRGLRAALSGIGYAVSEEKLTSFCQDGYEAGLLARRSDGHKTCYAAADGAAAAPEDEPLVFRVDDTGIEVDLERTGLQPLLELASVCRVQPAKKHLHVLPDIVLLGRAAPRLRRFSTLQKVRASSPAFHKALAHVERAQGKLILHEGLLVLRIEDLGFRMLLSHQFGDNVRVLAGPYMAMPRGFAGQAERLARKEGFSPRRIHCGRPQVGLVPDDGCDPR